MKRPNLQHTPQSSAAHFQLVVPVHRTLARPGSGPDTRGGTGSANTKPRVMPRLGKHSQDLLMCRPSRFTGFSTADIDRQLGPRPVDSHAGEQRKRWTANVE
ncbi:MAG TPA: hypothetical protein VE197_08950, partial [Mycobacterium sp.]|nr:hypothetical protein [Mycobacterium sp.]